MQSHITVIRHVHKSFSFQVKNNKNSYICESAALTMKTIIKNGISNCV